MRCSLCVCVCVCDLIFSAENKSIFPSILFSFEALDVAKCVSLNSFELDSHSHSKLHFWRFFVSMKKNEKKKKVLINTFVEWNFASLNGFFLRLLLCTCFSTRQCCDQSPRMRNLPHFSDILQHLPQSHPLGTREGHIRYQMITAPSVLIIITYNTSRMY